MRNEIFIGCGLRKDEHKLITRVVLKSGMAIKLPSGIELVPYSRANSTVAESPLWSLVLNN